ncbi:hypothetical protein [Desulfosporosinus sp. OT]|uniref:hypothetical protein n=1 Tax=Desulfosporosinus sp. OT TaxID=913865 RepID=UPI000223ACC2|nr:hypothetical protein [Desulfosporosinus sp. OT]EGW36886.1 putative lipoprotein [Desulfosporosinus sp. OT]
MFEKLKNHNKKWYLLLVLIILLGACGGLAARFYLRQQFQQNMQVNIGAQMARSVEQDLLYLDNTSTLKLSPDQAKAILPLIEKVSTSNTNSSPSINDLAKQIYEILNPVQYQALIDSSKSVAGNVEEKRQDGKKGNRRENSREFEKSEHITKGITDPKVDALKDIVIKMLKERSTEITKKSVS